MPATFPITVATMSEDQTVFPIIKPGFAGPYHTSSTTRYLVSTKGGNSDTGQATGIVFKSTDTGQTWVETDPTHAPSMSNSPKSSTEISSCLDLDGVRIWVVFINAAGNLAIMPFSTATDLWGAMVEGPTPAI